MKNGNIIFQSLVALAVIALFILHFSGDESPASQKPASSVNMMDKPESSIVYVRLDSLLNNYELHGKYLTAIEQRGSRIQDDLGRREQNLMAEAQTIREMAPQLNPVQLRSAQNDYMKIEEAYITYKQQVMTEFENYQDSLDQIVQQDLKEVIADLQNEMNFDYVLQYQGTLLYGDSLQDITSVLVQRLNDRYATTQTDEE